MGYKNIIFDIDGTLSNSFNSFIPAFKRAVLEVLGVELSEEETTKFFHLTNENTMRELGLNPTSEKAILINKLSSEYETKDPKLFDGVDEVINKLHEEGIFLGLHTSRETYQV